MGILNRVAPLGLLVLLTAGAATYSSKTAFTSQAFSPTPEQQAQELLRLQQDKEIRDRVQSEVEHTFIHTTTLINALLFLITLLPFAASAIFWSLRRSVISQIVAETKEQLHREVKAQLEREVTAELRKQTAEIKQEVDKQLEKEVAAELKKQTAASKQEIDKLTLELSQLFKLQKEVTAELQKQTTASKQEIEKLTDEFRYKILQFQSEAEK